MKLAYIQHGEWGGPYHTAMADGVSTGPAPRNPYIGGYGAKIPTQCCVLYRGHWRRVYAACYSNQSSLYVRIKGVDTLVSLEMDQ